MSIGRKRTSGKSPISLLWASLVSLLVWGWILSSPAAAEGPDYDLPGRLALPWACGRAYRISWTPADHWANGRTVGLAFDFALPEGTPLYAPADGTAYFLRDKRPSERNLGNYVDLVVGGEWLVRLAHLRDEQSGQQEVRAGELLGYSGSSGADAAHLHIELLVREGKTWARPDPTRLERLFGLPAEDLVEGVLIVNDGCPAHLVLEDTVRPLRERFSLGEVAELEVKVRNEGLQPLTLRAVQLSLQGPDGEALMAEAQGEWIIAGKALQAITISAQPNFPGLWQVDRVICQAEDNSYVLPAEGIFTVEPSELKLVGVSTRPAFEVGERIELEVWVENCGDDDLAVDDLRVEGLQPNGLLWTASAGEARVIPPHSLNRFLLSSPTVPVSVGYWRITRVGYEQGKRLFYLTQMDDSFAVQGPELRIVRAAVYASPKSLDIFLIVTNTGTRLATLDALEVWGWKPGGQEPFSIKSTILRQLEPGRSTLIRLAQPIESETGTWQLVEAGYWIRGEYYRLALPTQLTVEVAQPNLKPSP